jgi:5-methylcytosine-specific restriction endonuclease McrA
MKSIHADGREVLKGKAWQERRREVWERDGKRCRRCARRLSLAEAHIDHIQLRGMHGATRDDRADNLRTLCAACHTLRHGERRRK